MRIKDEIMSARTGYLRTYDCPPTLMFVSAGFHTELCLELKLLSMVGKSMCGMFVHLVPTLAEGFHIA